MYVQHNFPVKFQNLWIFKVNFFVYRPKLILDISKKLLPGHLVECSNDRRCVFTHDPSLADLSDAIIICLSTLCQSKMEVINLTLYSSKSVLESCAARGSGTSTRAGGPTKV